MAAVFLIIALIAFGYGILQLLNPATGWQQIDGNGGGLSYAGELVLQYNVSSAADRKTVTSLYTKAAREAYLLFDPAADSGPVDGQGIAYLNAHPNEKVQVAPALYRALAQVQASGDRSLFLGPVTAYYGNVFYCADDVAAGEYDPLVNDQVRVFFSQCAAFASDPQAVDLQLLDNNTVCVAVSEAYLTFAQEQEIDRFLDFGWMKNAFVVDYIAEVLTADGCVRGALSSYDGFVCNLGGSRESFRLNILARGAEAATLTYTGSMRAVSLRDYPLYEEDAHRFYRRADGQLRVPYLDPTDGLPRAAAADLLVYSENLTCGQLALLTAPVYLAESLTADGLASLWDAGAQTVRCQDRRVFCSDPSAVLPIQAEDGTPAYEIFPDVRGE